MKHNDIVVSISCITYNHAPYIRQCLDGFMMQKTNFAFEVLIHDDASTDGTTEIIKEYEAKYPEIIKPLYEEENQWVKGRRGSAVFNYPRAKGKYIALCEGDDYWTDPLKLQKQVDFLEANPKYGICYTKTRTYIQSSNNYGKIFGGPYTDLENMLNVNSIPTLTVVARKDLIFRYIEEINPKARNWAMGDYPMWLWFAHESKIKFVNEVTGVYRILQNSASHNMDFREKEKFVHSVFSIKQFFMEKYNLCNVVDMRSNPYNSLMTNAMMYGHYTEAISYYKQIGRKSIKSRLKYFMCKYPILMFICKKVLRNNGSI